MSGSDGRGDWGGGGMRGVIWIIISSAPHQNCHKSHPRSCLPYAHGRFHESSRLSSGDEEAEQRGLKGFNFSNFDQSAF